MFMVCPQGGHVWVVPQPAQGFSGVTINLCLHPRAVLVLGLEFRVNLTPRKGWGFCLEKYVILLQNPMGLVSKFPY